jgi:hypothetical protein
LLVSIGQSHTDTHRVALHEFFCARHAFAVGACLRADSIALIRNARCQPDDGIQPDADCWHHPEPHCCADAQREPD